MTTFRNFFLCAAAALAAVSSTGLAQAATETVDGVTWTYTVSGGKASVGGGRAVAMSTDGAITVPSLLGGCPVTSIGDWAFCGCSNLVSVTIPRTVTTIGTGAFQQCSSLASMTIPNSVTDIGEAAFEDCRSLASVTIPDSVTNIGASAFVECHRLASLTIPANVASIGGGAFVLCLGMKRIDVAAGNAHYASEGGILFTKAKDELVAYPCGKTGGYAIPAGVASIGIWAFCGCTNLASVTIPASVKSIGEMAFSYTALRTVYVSAGDTERVRGLFVSSQHDVSGIQFVEMDMPQTVWRFYSKAYKGHFFTISAAEKQNLIDTNPNWKFEGGAYRAYTNQATGTTALYRFYSKGYRGHFFTINAQEAEEVKKNRNWKYEGIAYYVYASAVAGTVPVHRFWSKGYKHHFYTTSETEKEDLVAHNPNWKYEGIAFYALPLEGAAAGAAKAAKGMEVAGIEKLEALGQLEGEEAGVATRAGRPRPGTGTIGSGVVVTTCDGTDGSAVADGDEGTGWSPEGVGAGWVALSLEEPVEVSGVELVGDGLPAEWHVLLSEDAETWGEEMPCEARYIWVSWPEGAPVVREVRWTP